jgi:hypothetical protein
MSILEPCFENNVQVCRLEWQVETWQVADRCCGAGSKPKEG